MLSRVRGVWALTDALSKSITLGQKQIQRNLQQSYFMRVPSTGTHSSYGIGTSSSAETLSTGTDAEAFISYWFGLPNLSLYSTEFMKPFTIVRESVGCAVR